VNVAALQSDGVTEPELGRRCPAPSIIEGTTMDHYADLSQSDCSPFATADMQTGAETRQLGSQAPLHDQKDATTETCGAAFATQASANEPERRAVVRAVAAVPISDHASATAGS
jgi:hypothetical protein